MTLGHKLINSKDLVVESWNLIKKDKSLLVPPILSLGILSILAIFSIIFLAGISSIVVGRRSFGLMAIIFLVIIFSIYFVATFFNAALTWMAYEVKKGKNTDIITGLGKAFREFFDIILFALMTFVIGILAGIIRGKGRGGISVLRDVAAKTVSAAWSVIGNLIMPAMILTDHHFFSAWNELKRYKDSIPQILVGTFGLGIIFSIISTLAFFVSVFVFFTMGVFAGVISVVLLIGPLMIISNAMKTLFFTLLYMQIKKL